MPVAIYARPKREQPALLQGRYDEVVRALTRAGARFHIRPGMHEKVAALDGSILWHGSLNILSHNDTRESMLRFESPALVRVVLGEIGIPVGAPTPIPRPTGEGASSVAGRSRRDAKGAARAARPNAGLVLATAPASLRPRMARK